MANIKCKYERYRCAHDMAAFSKICDDPRGTTGDWCEHITTTERNENEIKFYERCIYSYPETVMFEKNIKSWEIDDDYFVYRGKEIETEDIKYLEIDGEIIIEKK